MKLQVWGIIIIVSPEEEEKERLQWEGFARTPIFERRSSTSGVRGRAPPKTKTTLVLFVPEKPPSVNETLLNLLNVVNCCVTKLHE